jgi:hypothetical protein
MPSDYTMGLRLCRRIQFIPIFTHQFPPTGSRSSYHATGDRKSRGFAVRPFAPIAQRFVISKLPSNTSRIYPIPHKIPRERVLKNSLQLCRWRGKKGFQESKRTEYRSPLGNTHISPRSHFQAPQFRLDIQHSFAAGR